MKQFLLILLSVTLLSACEGTVVNTEVIHHVHTPPGFKSEAHQHDVARSIGGISRPRWGFQGSRVGSVSRMLSGYMNTPMWCFEERIKDIRIAKCTTKRHMDSVRPSENTHFKYVYAPYARRAGIAIPVFIDDCYLCGGWRRYY